MYRPAKTKDGEIGYMQIDHILALLFYCNFDTLSYEFSKTYRENIENHGQFYHLGKFLKIAVNAFGDGSSLFSEIQQLYHGISEKMVFTFNNHNELAINGPLSTSHSKEVAFMFTNHNEGLIISFNDTSMDGHTKYFSVDWLSDFGNERECLFIQMGRTEMDIDTFSLHNIIDPRTGFEYETLLDALSIFDTFFRSSVRGPTKYGKGQLETLIQSIVHHQLSLKMKQYQAFQAMTLYATRMCQAYFDNRNHICLEYGIIKAAHPWLFDLFFSSNGINLDVLRVLFPNIRCILFADFNGIGLPEYGRLEFTDKKLTFTDKGYLIYLTKYGGCMKEINIIRMKENDGHLLELAQDALIVFGRDDRAYPTSYFGKNLRDPVFRSVLPQKSALLDKVNEVTMTMIDDQISNSKQKRSTSFDSFCRTQKQLNWSWERIVQNKRSHVFDFFCNSDGSWINILNIIKLYPNLEYIRMEDFEFSNRMMDDMWNDLSKIKPKVITIEIRKSDKSPWNIYSDLCLHQQSFNVIGYTLYAGYVGDQNKNLVELMVSNKRLHSLQPDKFLKMINGKVQ